MLLVAKAPQNHRHANVHSKLKTRTIAEQLVTFVPQTNSAFVVYSFCLIVHFWLLSDFWPKCCIRDPETSSGWHKFPRPLWERGRERGQCLSNYSFSCTPCRSAFGSKSTAKPPTRQCSHQTKNSYHSRITRHFVPQTNSAFIVYSFCLIVHLWLLSA